MTSTILIGPGKWGKIVLENLRKYSKLSGIYNSKSNLKNEFISEIDWAVICTTNITHYKIINILLDKGTNIFCEKPLTLSSDQSTEVINKANKLGLKIYVNHIENFKNIKLNIKRENKIYRSKIASKNFEQILFDLAYHDIYLILKYIDIDNINISSIKFLDNKLSFTIQSDNKIFKFFYDLNSEKKHEINNENIISDKNLLPNIFSKVFSLNIDFDLNNKEAIYCNLILERIIKKYNLKNL